MSYLAHEQAQLIGFHRKCGAFMSQQKLTLQALPGTTLRRLRNTPSYFFLIWRWSMWLYALIIILGTDFSPFQKHIGYILLVVTFVQTLIVTLYAPVLHIFLPKIQSILRLPQQRRRIPTEDEQVDILTPLSQTRNTYWDTIIYSMDLIVCGIVVYYGGVFGDPPFGDGSVFYRYGISTVFAAGLAYRYRGGLAAALGYDLFVLFGILLPPSGSEQHIPNITDIAGSLIDAPIVALLTGYVATLLANYALSRRREQDTARRQQALVRVGETLMRGATDGQHLLQKSVTQIRQGGHFQRLIVALLPVEHEQEATTAPTTFSYVEDEISGELPSKRDEAIFQQVFHSGHLNATFEPLRGMHGYGLACLYVPIFKDGQVHMIMGAESVRQTPFNERQEKFLTISGTQLLVVLDNIRLTEQMIELAAMAERARIAREIHDGIAQLIYMLSLNTETCATQAHRIAEASDEDAELLLPLATRLDTLVTLSKQALWETRTYMFNLKPLLSGTMTLAQMLTNQLREFEAISGLHTQLAASVDEEQQPGEQVGTAIFRIVQEALTNAYKHASANEVHVTLQQQATCIEVSICDNGRGLPVAAGADTKQLTDVQRFYSGRGLQGMRERAQELGGTLDIMQQLGGGLCVHVRIPLTHNDRQDERR